MDGKLEIKFWKFLRDYHLKIKDCECLLFKFVFVSNLCNCTKCFNHQDSILPMRVIFNNFLISLCKREVFDYKWVEYGLWFYCIISWILWILKMWNEVFILIMKIWNLLSPVWLINKEYIHFKCIIVVKMEIVFLELFFWVERILD